MMSQIKENSQVTIVNIPTNPSTPRIFKWKIILPQQIQYEIKLVVSKSNRQFFINDNLVQQYQVQSKQQFHHSFTVQNEIFSILSLDPSQKPMQQEYQLINESMNNMFQKQRISMNNFPKQKEQKVEYLEQMKKFIVQAKNFMTLFDTKGLGDKQTNALYKHLYKDLDRLPNIISKLELFIQTNIDNPVVNAEQCLDYLTDLEQLRTQFEVVKVSIQLDHDEYKQKKQQKQQQQNQQGDIILQQPQQHMQKQISADINQEEQKEQPQQQQNNKNNIIVQQEYPQQSTVRKNSNNENGQLMKTQKVANQDNNIQEYNNNLILDLSNDSDLLDDDNQEHEQQDDEEEEEDEEEQNNQEKQQQSQKLDTENKQEPCIICMDQQVTHACIPCGHFKYCDDCAELFMQKKECAFCRQPAISFVKIYS